MWEVLGSKISRDIGYPDRGFLVLFLDPFR
jgi:hypothetical protein